MQTSHTHDTPIESAMSQANAQSDSQSRVLRIGTRSSKLALLQVDIFTSLITAAYTSTISNRNNTGTPAFNPSQSSHQHTGQSSPIRYTIHPLSTSPGDLNKTTDLHTLASTGKSLWTDSLESELLATPEPRVDVLIHSLKDVPTKLPLGCKVRAVGPRDESGDCVLLAPKYRRHKSGGDVQSQEEGGAGEGGASLQKIKGLADLARLATGEDQAGKSKRKVVVGTSSIRRAAMLRRAYPALEIADLRGNVPTRIRKLEASNHDEEEDTLPDPSSTSTPTTTSNLSTTTPHQTTAVSDTETPSSSPQRYDAIILASAGLIRLGLSDRIDEYLSWSSGMGHAVGQGALGVEWREGDEWVENLLAQIEQKTGRRGRWEGEAERACLRVLEGGCSVPVGVECSWEESGGGGHEEGGAGKGAKDAAFLTLKAMVVSVDGKRCVQGAKRHWVGCDEEAEGCGIAAARELVEKGAEEILKEIELNRGMLRGMGNA